MLYGGGGRVMYICIHVHMHQYMSNILCCTEEVEEWCCILHMYQYVVYYREGGRVMPVCRLQLVCRPSISSSSSSISSSSHFPRPRRHHPHCHHPRRHHLFVIIGIISMSMSKDLGQKASYQWLGLFGWKRYNPLEVQGLLHLSRPTDTPAEWRSSRAQKGILWGCDGWKSVIFGGLGCFRVTVGKPRGRVPSGTQLFSDARATRL